MEPKLVIDSIEDNMKNKPSKIEHDRLRNRIKIGDRLHQKRRWEPNPIYNWQFAICKKHKCPSNHESQTNQKIKNEMMETKDVMDSWREIIERKMWPPKDDSKLLRICEQWNSNILN